MIPDEQNGIRVAPENGATDDGFPSRENALELGGISIPGADADAKPKSKRGRKPGSKNKSNTDAQGEIDNAAVAFFAETCVMVIEAGDEMLKRLFVNRFKRYIKDEAQLEQFKASLLESNGVSERDKKILTAQFSALALKYPILARFGPELGITLWTLQYGARQAMVLRFIDSLKPKSSDGPPKLSPQTK